MPLERKKVGEVFHFYTKIGVAAIRVTDDGIAIGDTVQIQGPSTNLEQTVDALQIEHAIVSRAGPGQEVGMKVRDRVREKDFVYKLIPMEGPVQAAPPKEPAKAPAKMAPVKKAPAKKPRAKKAPRKKAPVRRKASRAPRSKARRASRRSRSRSR